MNEDLVCKEEMHRKFLTIHQEYSELEVLDLETQICCLI